MWLQHTQLLIRSASSVSQCTSATTPGNHSTPYKQFVVYVHFWFTWRWFGGEHPASARHHGSWQPQSGQTKISSTAGEVLASHKQMPTQGSNFFSVFFSIIKISIPSYEMKTHYSQDSMGDLVLHLVRENQQPMGNGRISPSCKTVAFGMPLGVMVLFRSWILVRSLSTHL